MQVNSGLMVESLKKGQEEDSEKVLVYGIRGDVRANRLAALG